MYYESEKDLIILN